MRKLWESSTFWFGAGILASAWIMGVESKDWLDAAVIALGIFAGKEGIRYGSDAYKDKP